MENKIKFFTAILGLIAAVTTFMISPLWNPNDPTPPINSPPISIDILSNASNPIYLGSSIKIVARAKDDDNDPIDHKFLLKGPSTDNLQEIVQDWSTPDYWIQRTNLCYSTGNYNIQVAIRDNKHSQSEGDDLRNISFYIKTNKCPILKDLNISPPNQFTLSSDPFTLSSNNPFNIVTVDAIADDPEGDQILYKFSCRGPSTDGKWETMTDDVISLKIDSGLIGTGWCNSSGRYWLTHNDVGLNQIKVEVMDDNEHCGKCEAFQVKIYKIIDEDPLGQ